MSTFYKFTLCELTNIQFINKQLLNRKQMQHRKRNEAEKEVMKMMIDADITQKMIAKHLDITPQAVNNRLKRGSVDPLIKAIEELKNNRS